MTNEDSKRHAAGMLEAAGYAVTLIPVVPNEKRADLTAEYDQDLLVVEAKGKAPHEEYLRLAADARSRGRSHVSRDERSWSALSSVAEQAERQLQATPAPEHAVQLLWISCLHNDWEFVFEGFRRCLYGRVELMAYRRSDSGPELVGDRACFYYDPPGFRRFVGIDGVVLANVESAQVLVNEFSPRVTLLRTTRLYREMNAIGALIDPPRECEEHGSLMISDPGIREPSDKHRYLLETYGLLTSQMQASRFDGLMVVGTRPKTDAT